MKHIAMFLILLLVSLSLVGCNSDMMTSPTPNESTTPNTVFPIDDYNDFPENLRDVHFENEHIGIVASGYDAAIRSITAEFDILDDPINSAVNKRNEYVESYLGVDIDMVETVSLEGMTEYLRSHFSKPDSDIDIIAVHQNYDLGVAYYGLDCEALGDLNGLTGLDGKGKSYINIDAPYWDRSMYDALMKGDSSYFVTGDISLSWLESIKVSYVNKTIWNEYIEEIKQLTGYVDIYELVKAGGWTLELIDELNDTVHINNDGNELIIGEGDQHGLLLYNADTGADNYIADAIISGCNYSFIEINQETGLPKMNCYTPNFSECAEIIHRLFHRSKSRTIEYAPEAGSTVSEIFSEGNTLVTLAPLGDAQRHLSEMEDEYYILPLPKLNGEQTAYKTTVGDDVTHFGILSTSDNISAAGATLELLGYFSYKLVTPEYYNLALHEKYFDDDNKDASSTLNSIRSGLYTDFAILFNEQIAEYSSYKSCLEYIREDVINPKSIGPTVVYVNNTWQKGLEKLLVDYGFTDSVLSNE